VGAHVKGSIFLFVCLLGVTSSSLTIFLLLDKLRDNFVNLRARKEVKKGNIIGDLKILFSIEEGDK